MDDSQDEQDFLFATPMIVIDFEATALTMTSYPIEVGVAWAYRPSGPIEVWSTLIKPDPSWDMEGQWDPDAERLHGISRWSLRDGMPADAVMAKLNEIMGATEAWCDGGHYDLHWLNVLAEASGVERTFLLGDMMKVLRGNNAALADYQAKMSRDRAEHRAGPDARRICAAML